MINLILAGIIGALIAIIWFSALTAIFVMLVLILKQQKELKLQMKISEQELIAKLEAADEALEQHITDASKRATDDITSLNTEVVELKTELADKGIELDHFAPFLDKLAALNGSVDNIDPRTPPPVVPPSLPPIPPDPVTGSGTSGT